MKILETAQGNELKTLVEKCKELLEKNYRKRVEEYGIQADKEVLIPLDELVQYSVLDTEEKTKKFQERRDQIWKAIKIEERALKVAIVKKKKNKSKKKDESKRKIVPDKNWNQAYSWFIDRLVYTFLNRLFAIRVMEALDLLKESTLIPQLDLGNRSARMAKIQEKYLGKSITEWQVMVINDVFLELSDDIRVIFDETDITTNLWPNGDVIAQLINYLNGINPEIYKTEDCIGWFYHYYVLKIRKGHKTMSSHGSKSPANPYYLSILNTVYTPRWMVQILVDNSLGHWWQDLHPKSKVFSESPYFIQKVPIEPKSSAKELLDLKILDPACGSGNFLIYAFIKLIEMYQETYPEWDLCKIIKIILTQNLYGVDINRRPAQLSAIALYILAKRTIKEKSPESLLKFKMPPVNIISCDIRVPKDDKNRILFLQKFKDIKVQKILKDLIDQFDNADQLGSLIDIRTLQKEINEIKQEHEIKQKKSGSLDKFLPNSFLKSKEKDYSLNLVEIVERELIPNESQNIGLQLFGKQAKNAASLAQILMQKYDIIVSNPPFGLSMDITKEKLKKFYPHTYRDLISAFIDQSQRLLKLNGYIAMISDFSFLHLPKFEKFRSEIFLKKLFIQYLLITGLGALPDARNVPLLFIVRKSETISEDEGLFRYVEYNSSQQFTSDIYIKDILNAIQKINLWNGKDNLPRGWNQINQHNFLNLPRSIIDLSIAEKYNPLLEFFTRYPRLDISQLKMEEKERLIALHVARAYHGGYTGNNFKFLRYWFEVNSTEIRLPEQIKKKIEITNEKNSPFVPFSKGGGDFQYYLANPYLIWWNKDSINEMDKIGSGVGSLQYQGKSYLHWPLVSGKPRGRFCISQKGLLSASGSWGIYLIINNISKFALISFLNSKYSSFFARLQTKDRKWPAGIIARFPIPIEFLKKNESILSKLSLESFQLRCDWDTGYPMSPIFAESLIDKVIENNSTILNIDTPKTGHPFCKEYKHCKSDVANSINQIKVKRENVTINKLIEAVEQRFGILTRRLNEIDGEINRVLYELIDDDTARALDDYYNTYVGNLGWESERDIWFRDFLMANLIYIIRTTSKGVIPLNSFKENESGLYNEFINLLSQKFNRDSIAIQPIIKELETLLEKELKRWISEDFFFYHCQRFGGRPIIWQFSSRSKSGQENAIDLFVDYHRINENTLPNIRVENIEPLLKILEQRRSIGTLLVEDVPKCDELEELIKAFITLENGYEIIPNPNALTGKNAQKGKGDDKTWGWVFSQAELIIKNGFKPDHFKGVLINIIPLCIELLDTKKKDFPLDYYSICPKGTLKQVLKKIDALDQLKNSGIKNKDSNENNEDLDEDKSNEEGDSNSEIEVKN